jgi:hypothetical protein
MLPFPIIMLGVVCLMLVTGGTSWV